MTSSHRKTAKPCPSCGGVMRRGNRQQTIEYQGYAQTYVQPGWWCDACEEGILEGDDNEFADEALHEVMVCAKQERGGDIVHKTDSE